MVDLLPEDTELLGGPRARRHPDRDHGVSGSTGLPALFVRKKAKEYGTAKLAEGPDVAGRRVTIIEDVITTGGAVRDATARAAGARARPSRSSSARSTVSPEGENPLADVGLEVRSGPHPRRPRRRAPLLGHGAASVDVAAHDVAVGAAVLRADLGARRRGCAGGATTR